MAVRSFGSMTCRKFQIDLKRGICPLARLVSNGYLWTLSGPLPNMPTPHSFSGVLVELRRARGMSQKSLAILAGMDQSYVAGLESGRRPPPKPKQISRLAEALQATSNEKALLEKARTADQLAQLSSAESPRQRSLVAQLFLVASCLSASDINTLRRVAGAMCSSAPRVQQGE